MIPMKRHQVSGLDLFRFAGLIVLIGFIYRHFGPGTHSPVTPSVIGVLAVGILMLMSPTILKMRQ
jgi:hypothetical protein